MHNAFLYVQEQYNAVKDTRAVLLNFCATLSAEDFVKENHSFGRGGSVRNLLVHIANVYESWIGNETLKKNIVFTSFESKQAVEEVKQLFEETDKLMDTFLELFKQDNPPPVMYESGGKPGSASLLKLFTHVITHEFHHKGQILSISRQMGYTPVDTDVIR